MFYQKDWFMRQIEMVVQMVQKLILGKAYTETKIEYNDFLMQTDSLYKKLMALIEDKKINEAENLLFDEFDANNKTHLLIALNFYETLSSFDEQLLEECDFSHEEIKDGLRDILYHYGMENIF